MILDRPDATVLAMPKGTPRRTGRRSPLHPTPNRQRCPQPPRAGAGETFSGTTPTRRNPMSMQCASRVVPDLIEQPEGENR
jgi:hypothetical protein